jgi:hypothetical protein
MTSRATALKRTGDPGWAFVAVSDEEMAQVLGSHVETLPAAIQKLREGGAMPDRKAAVALDHVRASRTGRARDHRKAGRDSDLNP